MTPAEMRAEFLRLKALAAPYNGVSRGQMAEKLRPEVLDLFALCTEQAARIVELEEENVQLSQMVYPQPPGLC